MTPYYNKPTQAGLIAHYTALHDCCALPIIIYNIPGRSVVDMTPETMGVLAKLPRIIGVKDATGKIERVVDAARVLRGGFHPAVGRGCDGAGLQRPWRGGLHLA